jgi:DNA-binding transcriptional LysR family regulator
MIALVQGQPAARWEDVRLFLALHRERTLASAGAALGLDPSTLSRRLVALEEALDTQLFDRTREGLVPTAAAELLLPAAEEMAAAHARFLQDASGFERVAEGVVRLSVPPGLAESFIAAALGRLHAKHPRIQIELDASTRFVDLTRREADIAIRTQRPLSGDLVFVKVGQRRWTPMIARKDASRGKPVADWGQLRWIAWADDLQAFPPARWIAQHVPPDAVVFRTSHFSAQVSAVEGGVGAALLPPVYARLAAVAPVRHSSALRSSVDELPISETWLIGHRALRNVPRVAAVWTFLVEEFARFEDRPAFTANRIGSRGRLARGRNRRE